MREETRRRERGGESDGRLCKSTRARKETDEKDKRVCKWKDTAGGEENGKEIRTERDWKEEELCLYLQREIVQNQTERGR